MGAVGTVFRGGLPHGKYGVVHAEVLRVIVGIPSRGDDKARDVGVAGGGQDGQAQAISGPLNKARQLAVSHIVRGSGGHRM